MKKARHVVVAIDGPAGAGKSTLARELALRLQFLYVDTGAMYRALTWKALEANVSLRDPQALGKLARSTEIELLPNPAHAGSLLVEVDGLDVTHKIRTEKVSLNTNAVASVAAVREHLVKLQRAMGKKRSLVMEGRDIGTQVFPKASIKFFLDASPMERAKRRYLELKARGGKRVSLERIAHAIAQRDYHDRHRASSPLKPAADAIPIDSTHLSLHQAVELMLKFIQSKLGIVAVQ